MPTESFCLRSWLDLGLQLGSCARGKSESSNPTTQHCYVQRMCAYNSSDGHLYPSWPKTCLRAVLGLVSWQGWCAAMNPAPWFTAAEPGTHSSKMLKKQCTCKPVRSPVNFRDSPVLKHLAAAGLSSNYIKRWKGGTLNF